MLEWLGYMYQALYSANHEERERERERDRETERGERLRATGWWLTRGGLLFLGNSLTVSCMP